MGINWRALYGCRGCHWGWGVQGQLENGNGRFSCIKAAPIKAHHKCRPVPWGTAFAVWQVCKRSALNASTPPRRHPGKEGGKWAVGSHEKCRSSILIFVFIFMSSFSFCVVVVVHFHLAYSEVASPLWGRRRHRCRCRCRCRLMMIA